MKLLSGTLLAHGCFHLATSSPNPVVKRPLWRLHYIGMTNLSVQSPASSPLHEDWAQSSKHLNMISGEQPSILKLSGGFVSIHMRHSKEFRDQITV